MCNQEGTPCFWGKKKKRLAQKVFQFIAHGTWVDAMCKSSVFLLVCGNRLRASSELKVDTEGRFGLLWIRFRDHLAVAQNRYQNGTLVSGSMDQNLRNPSCLMLSHTHF